MKNRHKPPHDNEENADDRRRSRRLRRITPVLVTDPERGTATPARTEDASLYGYGLRLTKPLYLRPGQVVHVRFEESLSQVHGKIAWTTVRNGLLDVGLNRIPVLRGNVETTPLSNLFIDHHAHRSTGILTFRNSDHTVTVYLEKGKPVYAQSTRPGVGFARILYRLKKISADDLTEIQAEATATGKPEQTILLRRGFIKSRDLINLMRIQAEHVVAGLFRWSRGSFVFESRSLENLRIPRMVLNTGRIVTAGLRRADGDTITPYIPSTSAPLIRGVDPFELDGKARLNPVEARILRMVESGSVTADDILRNVAEDRETTRRALAFLHGAVLIEQGAEYDENEEPPDDSPQDPATNALMKDIDAMVERVVGVTYYEMLDVRTRDPAEKIKQAFYRLARRYHPDYNRHLPADYQDRLHGVFTRIHEAYSVLTNPGSRSRYDRELVKSAGTGWARPKETKKAAPTAEDIFHQGQAAYAKGDYAGSAESFRWAAKLAPTKSNYHFAAGKALAKLPRRGKEAEEALLKATDLAPYNVDYFFELGKFYVNSDLKTRARTILNKVLELDPEHNKAKQMLANLG